jgi:D-alanyl-D-alanine carboxypeptidase
VENHDCSNRIISALNELGIPQEVVTDRGLQLCCEAENLVVVEVAESGREHKLEPEAAKAWFALRDAAGSCGVNLYIVSAFRSFSSQTEIIRRKLDLGLSLEQILAVSAVPGYSEHHTGRAVDIGTPGCAALEPEFEGTPAFQWLAEHAGAFGFVLSYPRDNPFGYLYEPWHWFFQGGRLLQYPL